MFPSKEFVKDIKEKIESIDKKWDKKVDEVQVNEAEKPSITQVTAEHDNVSQKQDKVKKVKKLKKEKKSFRQRYSRYFTLFKRLEVLNEVLQRMTDLNANQDEDMEDDPDFLRRMADLGEELSAALTEVEKIEFSTGVTLGFEFGSFVIRFYSRAGKLVELDCSICDGSLKFFPRTNDWWVSNACLTFNWTGNVERFIRDLRDAA